MSKKSTELGQLEIINSCQRQNSQEGKNKEVSVTHSNGKMSRLVPNGKHNNGTEEKQTTSTGQEVPQKQLPHSLTCARHFSHPALHLFLTLALFMTFVVVLQQTLDGYHIVIQLSFALYLLFFLITTPTFQKKAVSHKSLAFGSLLAIAAFALTSAYDSGQQIEKELGTFTFTPGLIILLFSSLFFAHSLFNCIEPSLDAWTEFKIRRFLKKQDKESAERLLAFLQERRSKEEAFFYSLYQSNGFQPKNSAHSNDLSNQG